MKRIGPKRAPAAVCPVCKAGPHRPSCVAVAAEKAHVAALREAWAPPAPKAAHTPAQAVERVRPADSDGEMPERQKTLLRGLLELAVPMWVQRFRDEGRTWESLRLEAQGVADDICLSATSLLWAQKGYVPKAKDIAARAAVGCPELEPPQRALGSADMFNQLAKGLAIGSFVPGGATHLGCHWQSDMAWLKPEGA